MSVKFFGPSKTEHLSKIRQLAASISATAERCANVIHYEDDSYLVSNAIEKPLKQIHAGIHGQKEAMDKIVDWRCGDEERSSVKQREAADLPIDEGPQRQRLQNMLMSGADSISRMAQAAENLPSLQGEDLEAMSSDFEKVSRHLLAIEGRLARATRASR